MFEKLTYCVIIYGKLNELVLYLDEYIPNNICILFVFHSYLLSIKQIYRRLGKIGSQLDAPARDYNRIASFGVNVLTTQRDSTGQNLKCSESERLVKTGRM